MTAFSTNPWRVSTLLTDLDLRRVMLPEFQRSFVWLPRDVDELLTSIVKDFPAGSLLFLRTGGASDLAWRAVEGVTQDPRAKPEYLVLDGQQRLTSLSRALNGRGEHLFFMNLLALEANDFDNGI